MRAWTILCLLAACGGEKQRDPQTDADTDVDTDTDSDTDTDTDTDTLADNIVGLELSTRDGVTLVADWYDAGGGRPAVVLLHMNPEGGWSRADWPANFIGTLVDHSWSVLVLDRRGGGDSEGDAREAWEGPKGKWDVEAAADFVAQQGADPLVIVSASNGTTSMIDYVGAAADQGWAAPVGLVFLTGGTYTEANTTMDVVGSTPCFFGYASNEKAWSEQQRSRDPGDWVFTEYATLSGHGTELFSATPEVTGDLEAYLDKLLP